MDLPDRLFKAAAVAMSGLSVLVTVLCLAMFQKSPFYLTFLGGMFLVALVKAFVDTTAGEQRVKLYGRITRTAQEHLGKKRKGPNRGHKQESVAGAVSKSEPVVDYTHGKDYAVPALSIDQYLQLNGFTLNEEIVEAIEWKRFELLCHLILRASGFNSRLTGDGADEGVDIRVYDQEKTSLVLYLIQCKKWKKGSKIDRPLLQQLRGQMAAENVSKGAYCTTSAYTQPAREFAAANHIELFDRAKIIKTFNRLEKTARITLLKQLLEGDYWTPSCATCGKKFTAKITKKGNKVWACDDFQAHGWSSIPYYQATPVTSERGQTI